MLQLPEAVSATHQVSTHLPLPAAHKAAPTFHTTAVDAANLHWGERQFHVDQLAHLSSEYDAAYKCLPAWAQSGPERIDSEGNLCGPIVNWPQIDNIEPAQVGERIVRPSIWQARESFEFSARVFAYSPASREKYRAAMRRSIRAVVARLRERRHLQDELGLTALDSRLDEACRAICAAEDSIAALEQSSNSTAALLMAKLSHDCSRFDAAAPLGFEGAPGYCEAMSMALVALHGLLPGLSGLIREHAAFYVGNSALPLSDMPFTAV
jgi:hypothetical protein